MQILLALIAGAVIGTAAHFAIPARDTRGVLVLPLLGTFLGGLTWMVLTWAGFGLDNPLLWLMAILVPALITFPTGTMLVRLRQAHDARERARLKIS